MTPALRVIKVGGSLLSWPDLVPAFRRWLSMQPTAANVVVVGGGALVDAIRQLDRQHRLEAEVSHWLSVRAMSLTAELFVSLLGDARLVSRIEDLDRRGVALQAVDVESFLRQDAKNSDGLPCNWDVTSDSIAARAAHTLEARELVLLKSTLPQEATLDLWCQSGIVDPYFPRAAVGLAVRCVNLRSDRFHEVLASGDPNRATCPATGESVSRRSTSRPSLA
jgi:5-(aminomethyl)-3-furanmethanol phosphate kinase